ncbi:cell wall hydrolase, partial [Halobacillus karajensis]|uniref:cell wall hydrolase n=1 Tax=Halobacillus karajensis TaxID=195088 RepID=UPI00068AF9D5
VLAELNPQIEDIDLIYPDQEVKTEQSGKAAVPGSDEKANVTAGQEKETFRNHELLAQLVEAEAKGETFKGKVAVAEVVLNRVEHSTFPDSVEAVIYQEGQFSPVSNGSINKPASEESKRAVHEAMGSEDITQGSLFFHNPAESNSSYMHAKQPIVIIGNHEFSK